MGLADAFGDETEKRRRELAKTLGRFTVNTVTPFTVFMDGSTEAMPGTSVLGLTYLVGTTGMYFHVQGLPPVCIPTAA